MLTAAFFKVILFPIVSMIALNVCLLAPLQDAQSKYPGVRQVLYVD